MGKSVPVALIALSIAVLLGSSLRAGATDLQTCCRGAARQKGYSGATAACYASVCVNYVSMQSDGRRCLAFGKTFEAYRGALLSTCNIQR